MPLPLQRSELPISPNGRIYHLDLLPEELAECIITVGDPRRVAQVSQHFETIEVQRQHREFITHTGVFQNKRLTVLSTGIGSPNIDIVMNELDALANIDFKQALPRPHPKSLNIVRLGTAGALQKNLTEGDIVLTRYGVGLEGLLNYYDLSYDPEELSAKQALLAHCENTLPPIDPYIVRSNAALSALFDPIIAMKGLTLTCCGFYGPQNRHVRAPLKWPQWQERLATFRYQNLPVMNFEMETAAILGLGRLLGHRCASLSVIINNRARGSFCDNVDLAVENAIEKVLMCLCNGLDTR